MDYKQIPLIIPSLEPDEKLPRLLEQLHAAGIQNIVLVDDGSGPAYAHFFEDAQQRWGCPVLRHAVNLGKGRALKTAFNYCLNTWPDAPGCVTADSDGQHTPECILKVMKALTERPDALILGCRDFDEKDVPLRSSFGNKCTRFVFKALVGLSITDTQTGLRAIPTSFMKTLMHSGGERFEFESNMLIDTKEAGVPIVEVPIETVYIEENKTSHFNPLRDSARIYAVFGKFLFSSLSSSVVDLALFSLFCMLLNSFVSGTLYITLATVCARVISATYNYLLNYKLVFKSREHHGMAASKYFFLAVVQMACSAGLVSLLYALTGGFSRRRARRRRNSASAGFSVAGASPEPRRPPRHCLSAPASSGSSRQRTTSAPPKRRSCSPSTTGAKSSRRTTTSISNSTAGGRPSRNLPVST